jgi:hypothetical protein
MVEVIRQGTRNLADCRDCGSRLKYEPRDITHEREPPGMYEFDECDCYSIMCPCGCKIDVSSKISSGIARRVELIEEERRLSDYDV